MKTLTIIVPIFNKEDLLRQCLDSMNIPECKEDLEVLLIDDGSQDDSYEIAKQYAAKEPNVFKAYTQPNQGVGTVMSKGISIAKGRYFKEVDADDWLDSMALVSLVDYLKKTDVDIVVNPFQIVNEETADVEEHFYKNVKFRSKYNIEDIISHSGLSIQACTIRKALFEENNFVLSKQRYYVDMQLVESAILYAKSCVVLKESLYRYRIGQAEQSVNINSYIKHRRCFFEETLLSLKRLNEAVDKNLSSEKIAVQKRCCESYCVYLFGITSLCDDGDLVETDKMIMDNSREIYDSEDNIALISKYRNKEFATEYDYKQWVRNEYVEICSRGDIDGLRAFYYIGNNIQSDVLKGYDLQLEQKNILNQWMLNMEQGILPEQYFEGKGYKCIAIYGLGILGDHLYRQLKKSNIQVKYIIDQKVMSIPGDVQSDVTIIKPSEKLQKIDVVVVTALMQYKEIKILLSDKVECDIISIENVIYG